MKFPTQWKNEKCSKPPTRDKFDLGCSTKLNTIYPKKIIVLLHKYHKSCHVYGQV